MLEPCLPPEWQSAEVTHRIGATTYEIELVTASGVGPAGAGRGTRAVARTELDGTPCHDPTRVPVYDDGGTHRVLVTLERGMS